MKIPFLFFFTLFFISCQNQTSKKENEYPVAICSWSHPQAIEKAIRVMNQSQSSLDAVEQGIRSVESDSTDQSVGLGGLPDRNGHVTLDACIMDAKGNAGSVTYVQDVLHPISLARAVMEKTSHVMLSGEGATAFAKQQNLKTGNLLTEHAKQTWEKWLQQNQKDQLDTIFEADTTVHDTVGLLAIDKDKNMAGGCSSSGAKWKLPGRVGDSPIIGAGLFIDNEIGGATATGMGEMVLTTMGSFLAVEYMRNGDSPQQAAERVTKRIYNKYQNHPVFGDKNFWIVVLNKKGEVGAFGINKGLQYTVNTDGKTVVKKARSLK